MVQLLVKEAPHGPMGPGFGTGSLTCVEICVLFLLRTHFCLAYYGRLPSPNVKPNGSSSTTIGRQARSRFSCSSFRLTQLRLSMEQTDLRNIVTRLTRHLNWMVTNPL